MSSETIASADSRMSRAVEAMERDFQAFRTGRASTALVERLTVDYYGTQTPLNQLAGISSRSSTRPRSRSAWRTISRSSCST